MQKQIYDLVPQDLANNIVWIFPMDDTVDDEDTVRPVTDESQLNDLQVIVKTIFHTQDGSNFIGYIYWGEPSKVEYIKPVMFIDPSGQYGISFWSGIIEPTDSDFDQAKGILNAKSFPIRFESENVFGLYAIRGELEGIYYLDRTDNIALKTIPF